MSIKYIGIIVLAVAVVGGGFAYFAYSHPQNAAGTIPGTPPSGPGNFNGSLADLVARGGDWQCTFNLDANNPSTTGKIFISGTTIRADFTSTIAQLKQTIDSHMIQDGGYVYVWTSLAAQGFKTKSTLGTPEATQSFQNQGVNINQKYEYHCDPWTADASLFVPPANVNFVGQ